MPPIMSRPRPSAQHGFTLTEILVGMVIGLITILAIMQAMSAFEAQKRTTSGSNDAQTSGSIALYTIQRMLQSSGVDLPIYSGNFHPYDCDPEPTIIDNGTTVGIFPVSITDGGTGAGASDNITVRGDLLPPSTASQTGQSFAGMPTLIAAAPNGSTTLTVNNNMACATGDYAFTMQSSSTYGRPAGCSKLYRVISTSGTQQITLDSTPTSTGIYDGLTCLKNWTQLTYSVDTSIAGGALTENAKPIAPGIVMLRAQYGISDPNNPASNAIVSWVSATGDWVTPNIANRKLIKAVHIAIIARSGQYEKDVVSTPCSSLTDANPTGVCAWAGSTTTGAAPSVDLSSDPNWQHYRYRIFETVIPLRNPILGGNTL